MMADESTQLLQQFTRERSEAAFRELVRQHSPVVYGTALRMLGGNRAAAQDVTQEVFTLLVQKAGQLGDVVLSAWLYRQACRRASNHVRTESRRKQRELVAANLMNASSSPDADAIEALSGEVDAALLSLPSPDRDALVLRYFEGQDFRKLGATLGTTEEAARKRVTRAIEKLSAALQKRGIAVGSASLGTTMASLGSTPVPASVITQVTAGALKALPASGWSGLMPWLKPLLAGVLAASLAAVSTLAIQRHTTSIVSVTPAPPAPPEDPRPAYFRPISSSASLDDLIAEIKRASTGPKHSLTRLRVSAILEQIGFDQMPEFFSLAHDNLTTAEQAACYQRLLGRWAQADPDAALGFALEQHHYWQKADALNHTNLFNNIFETWMRQDLDSAQTWLLKKWGAEGFKEPAFEGSLGEFLALQITNERVRKTGVGSAMDFVQSLPDEKTRRRALGSLAGKDTWMSAWQHADDTLLTELVAAFRGLPDKTLGRELSASLSLKLAQSDPDRAARVEALLEPKDRFYSQLGSLGVQSKPTRREMLSGGRMTEQREPVNGLENRDQVMADGLAAGLSRKEVLEGIGATLIDIDKSTEALAWIDQYRDEVDFEPLLRAKLASYPSATGRELQIIDWASRLNDPEQGHALCRAAYRRLLTRGRGEAKNLLARQDLPADLIADFQQIYKEAP